MACYLGKDLVGLCFVPDLFIVMDRFCIKILMIYFIAIQVNLSVQ